MASRRELPPRGRERDRYLQRKYGITQADFEHRLRDQGHRCAICRRAVSRASHWHIDHDHESGAVRGILCAACNVGLGFYEDDPALLQAAADYLSKGRP